MNPVSILLFLRSNWKMIAAGVALLAAAYAAHWVTAKVYQGKIAKIELAQVEAEKQALIKGQTMQRAADQVAIDLAGQQAAGQERIIIQTVKIKEEIPIYVQDNSNCITFGFVRMLDARASGVDPASLVLPAGQSNESCTSLKWTDLAGSIVGNYGTSAQNSLQLTDLQTYVVGIKKALTP